MPWHAACLRQSMNAEREDPTKATERWPFDPMQPGDHEPAQLPGGTATASQKKDESKPRPRAKPVDPPP
jgi:hypothetical protein